eukprot:381509-Pleurochrysis_carterae.AAC.1
MAEFAYSKPCLEVSQVAVRLWLEYLQPWLITCNLSCTPLDENGCVITKQGRVVVVSIEHAYSIFFRLDTMYTFDSPSPIIPTFPPPVVAAPVSAASTARPTMRASARIASASFPFQPPFVSTPPSALTDAKRARFVVAPGHIDSMDRQLIESIALI